MNEQRIAAYVNLIQQLLTCPSGEETQILIGHLKLVDEGFVQVCEQEAAQLQEQGQENQAAFLRNLAQQLGAFLEQETAQPSQSHTIPAEYETFLQEALRLTSESSVNPSVVYPFLAGQQANINEDLIALIPAFATRRNIIDLFNFAKLLQQFPLGQRAINLEIAIAIYTKSLDFFDRQNYETIWATIQNNLAIAYGDRIKGELGDNIEKAIRYYQDALEVRTRTAFPEKWAETQNNLGNAYSQRIKGERTDNIEQAIAAYEAALEVRTRIAFPENWAETQNNLANAYLYRIKGERTDNIEQAIRYYEAALEVYTRTAFPEKWATIQNNLANAYSYRIKGERADNIEQAIAAYEAALEVRTRTAFPEQWAMTKNNLANAYLYRIKKERGDNIEQAIADLEAALEVRTRTAFPEDWASTQVNLADTLLEFFECSRQRSGPQSSDRNLSRSSGFLPTTLLNPRSPFYPLQVGQGTLSTRLLLTSDSIVGRSAYFAQGTVTFTAIGVNFL